MRLTGSVEEVVVNSIVLFLAIFRTLLKSNSLISNN